MVRNDPTVTLGGYHLAYSIGLQHGIIIIGLYIVATCGSLLSSGFRHIVVFGLANLVAVVVLARLSADGSLRCGASMRPSPAGRSCCTCAMPSPTGQRLIPLADVPERGSVARLGWIAHASTRPRCAGRGLLLPAAPCADREGSTRRGLGFARRGLIVFFGVLHLGQHLVGGTDITDGTGRARGGGPRGNAGSGGQLPPPRN